MAYATVLTAEQVAELLQLHKSTVQSLARSDALPERKIGREWRFIESELLWDSTKKPTALSGGQTSPSTGSEYVSQLGNMIKQKRNASMTSEKPRNTTRPS